MFHKSAQFPWKGAKKTYHTSRPPLPKIEPGVSPHLSRAADMHKRRVLLCGWRLHCFCQPCLLIVQSRWSVALFTPHSSPSCGSSQPAGRLQERLNVPKSNQIHTCAKIYIVRVGVSENSQHWTIHPAGSIQSCCPLASVVCFSLPVSFLCKPQVPSQNQPISANLVVTEFRLLATHQIIGAIVTLITVYKSC